MSSTTLKTREHQLETILYLLYKACQRKPKTVKSDVFNKWVVENYKGEFDPRNTIDHFQELSRAGFVEMRFGSIKLLPDGIHAVESLKEIRNAPKIKATNFGPEIPTSEEIRTFLTTACEEVDFDLAAEFNCITIGGKLGFSAKKIDRCRQRAKTEMFIHEPNIGTNSNTRSQITTKTLGLIMGQIDEREGAITVNDHSTKNDNSTNLSVGGSMIGSNVAQNSAGAVQALTFTAGQKLDFQNFVDLARTSIDDLGLSDAVRAEFSNSLDIIEGTLANGAVAEPEKIEKELTIAQRVIEGAAGSAAGSVLAEHLPTLWTYIKPFV